MVFCALAHGERCRRSMLRGFVFAGHAVQAWRLYASWYVSIASPRLLLKYVLGESGLHLGLVHRKQAFS